jgi:hypothetical protein
MHVLQSFAAVNNPVSDHQRTKSAAILRRSEKDVQRVTTVQLN